ncbi:MAG TPA: cation transporter dimerization domain-containing protein [Verrucomicrobiota bacterium]|nr:cation transporter dimerization domain-containing protein [Verrucomicrobiota bacterium]HRZ36152.1 cation transporter dimerization domain-containing protein [Candidatus Paceibacterota bacterium]HRZ55054.1 cation transporter dimerization domain-containing protein [Candidatus Paceibacterota bacterium]
MVEMAGDPTVRRGHEIGHQVSDRLKSSSLAVEHVVVHIEPAPAAEDGFSKTMGSHLYS